MTMKHYVVLYRDDTVLAGDPPMAFVCQADDANHAEEQCIDAYTGCEVMWVYEGKSTQSAYLDYWEEA